jgi:hypothetical protein
MKTTMSKKKVGVEKEININAMKEDVRGEM